MLFNYQYDLFSCHRCQLESRYPNVINDTSLSIAHKAKKIFFSLNSGKLKMNLINVFTFKLNIYFKLSYSTQCSVIVSPFLHLPSSQIINLFIISIILSISSTSSIISNKLLLYYTKTSVPLTQIKIHKLLAFLYQAVYLH